MSDHDLITFCGLYCDLCAHRCAIPHRAQELRELVREEGFDFFYEFVPEWKSHYPSFVKMLEDLSHLDCQCRNGSGGPPGCEIRICAREKEVFVCMECKDYPCPKWNQFAQAYPFLVIDAAHYREVGREQWLKEQKGKVKKGFNYGMMRRIQVMEGSEDKG